MHALLTFKLATQHIKLITQFIKACAKLSPFQSFCTIDNIIHISVHSLSGVIEMNWFWNHLCNHL